MTMTAATFLILHFYDPGTLFITTATTLDWYNTQLHMILLRSQMAPALWMHHIKGHEMEIKMCASFLKGNSPG